MGRHSKNKGGGPRFKNPVAKHAHINKATVFRDRTRYRRRDKHRGSEPFPMSMPKLA